VDVKAGAQTGDTIRLKGLGAQQLRREGRGDIFVTLAVETPTSLTADQRALLEQLAEERGETAPTGSRGAARTGPASRHREPLAGRCPARSSSTGTAPVQRRGTSSRRRPQSPTTCGSPGSLRGRSSTSSTARACACAASWPSPPRTTAGPMRGAAGAGAE